MKKSFWVSGREEPYTNEEITELRCVRCGKKAHAQWQICSDGNIYRPLCNKCDILLNNCVLKFLGHPRRKKAMKAYRGAATTSTSTELAK